MKKSLRKQRYWKSTRYSTKFLIYFSAKCANTTLRKWFLDFEYEQNVNDIGSLRDESDRIRKKYRNQNYSNFKKLILVRNPYDRCVSMFIDKFINKQDTVYKTLCENDITFNDFLNLLLEEKKKSFENTDEHFIPQIMYRYDIKFDYIIKLESFEKDMMYFINKEFDIKDYKYDFNEKVFNFKSNYSNTIVDNLSNLKLSELKKYDCFNKNLFLTDENKKIIKEIYLDDFNYLGYDI